MNRSRLLNAAVMNRQNALLLVSHATFVPIRSDPIRSDSIRFAIASIWQIYDGNKEQYTTFGVLEWEPGDTVLHARSAG